MIGAKFHSTIHFFVWFNNQVLFCRSHFVDLQKPKKSLLSENYCTNDSRFVCQRTEKWFQIRKRAKVASSTSNAAVGLKKIKEKHTHLDKNEPDEEMNRGMKFGIASATCNFSPFSNLKPFFRSLTNESTIICTIIFA
jgi:hypothetical protein